jgi:hypothetical protein
MTKYEIVVTQYGENIKKTEDDGTIWFVPKDPANSDYQEYLAQLETE